MGRALWRELVIGFAGQLGELRLGFTQLAGLYVLADGSTLTVGELAEAIGRSPSATSRLVDGLVRRRLVERHQEPEDRRQRTLRLTQRGHAILRVVDRGRADQFLSVVRPLPRPSGRSSRWAWPRSRRMPSAGAAAIRTPREKEAPSTSVRQTGSWSRTSHRRHGCELAPRRAPDQPTMTPSERCVSAASSLQTC